MPQLDALAYCTEIFWVSVVFLSFHQVLSQQLLPIFKNVFIARRVLKLTNQSYFEEFQHIYGELRATSSLLHVFVLRLFSLVFVSLGSFFSLGAVSSLSAEVLRNKLKPYFLELGLRSALRLALHNKIVAKASSFSLEGKELGGNGEKGKMKTVGNPSGEKRGKSKKESPKKKGTVAKKK